MARDRRAGARRPGQHVRSPAAHPHRRGVRMSTQPVPPSMVLRPEEIERFDRGNGVVTIPFVGRWNCADNRVTTGMTVFSPGTGIPLHSHNVEETVLVYEGEATAVVGDDEFDLVAGQIGRASCRERV